MNNNKNLKLFIIADRTGTYISTYYPFAINKKT